MARLLVPTDRTAFHRNNFDAIRLAMALLVVFSHSYAIGLGSEDREPLSIATNGYYNSGNIGVWAFFVISGFLIARSHERSATNRSYMTKRIRRIYPGYLVATSLCAFLITPAVAGPGFTLTLAEIARTIGANLLLANHFPLPVLFTGNPSYAVNGSLWSIKYEFLCYIGVMSIGLFALPVRRVAIPLLYIGVVLIWCWLDVTGRKPGGGSQLVRDIIGWPYLWFQVLPNFLAGMILYLHRDRVIRSTPLLVAGLGACLLAFHLGGHRPIGIVAAHLIAPPVLAYAVLWFAFHPGIRLSGIARHGDFSYGTYLYAFVIQQLLVARLDLPFPVFVLSSMLLALAAGVASWWLIERHFLHQGKRPADH